ncbi:unnamed protein product [Coffea canephora]|uniref:Uncharacterized protein n=1 Tax=Coffea canephora TaxID=49390 RepID=A0A068V5Y5_COFCA|nr:unnamed protein product [Coffea canephora]
MAKLKPQNLESSPVCCAVALIPPFLFWYFVSHPTGQSRHPAPAPAPAPHSPQPPFSPPSAILHSHSTDRSLHSHPTPQPPFSPPASILLIFSFPLSVNFFPVPHLQPQPHPPDKSSPLNQATEFLPWPVARLILATVTDSPYVAATRSHLGRARGLYHTPIHCILLEGVSSPAHSTALPRRWQQQSKLT